MSRYAVCMHGQICPDCEDLMNFCFHPLDGGRRVDIVPMRGKQGLWTHLHLLLIRSCLPADPGHGKSQPKRGEKK